MIKLPAYLTGFSSRSDGSAGVRFATQELDEKDFIELKRGLNNFGWLVFKENDIKADDIPDEQADESKKPSQRLRSVLYVFWQQNRRQEFPDFEVYYRTKMEEIITSVKSKLD